MANIPTLLQYLKNGKGFNRVMEKVKILSVGEGKCLAELKIDEDHTNTLGGLHGGLSATLVDVITSYALMTKVGNTVPHVSVDLHMSYLKGAKVDDSIIIDANVVRSGKTLAFLEAVIKNKKSGDVLAKGTHTKFLMQ